jgi:hypothetical protein
MDVALAAILLVAAAGIGWYDTYSVQRTYADVYASRYGRIPPLFAWFFVRDPDVEVEDWRRRHRNMYVLVAILAVAALVIVLLGARG